MAVFHFPGEPSQAYVKRVVGLPGESMQIVDGNVMIDGRIARKSLDELRAMQILVHDSRYVPHDSDRFPRWVFPRAASRHRLASGWSQSEGRFVHEAVKPAPNEPGDRLDWLVYRHWDPVLNQYGPIRDYYAYNGGDLGTDHVVADLSLEARLTLSLEVELIAIVIRSGGDRFLVRIPVQGEGQSRWLGTITSSSWFPGQLRWPRSTVGRARSCSRLRSSTTGSP